MYRSQQYLEVGGKFIENPFKEGEQLHGVSLHDVMFQLHASEARKASDLKTLIMHTVKSHMAPNQMDKASEIYRRIMTELDDIVDCSR